MKKAAEPYLPEKNQRVVQLPDDGHKPAAASLAVRRPRFRFASGRRHHRPNRTPRARPPTDEAWRLFEELVQERLTDGRLQLRPLSQESVEVVTHPPQQPAVEPGRNLPAGQLRHLSISGEDVLTSMKIPPCPRLQAPPTGLGPRLDRRRKDAPAELSER
jgi:hypothetical protein